MKIERLAITVTAFVCLGVFLFLTGCEVDSPEIADRNVAINVNGFYQGILSEGRLIHRVSGAAIRYLDLRQTGETLQAYDNNGNIFKGTIGQVTGDRATITLQGKTTSGAVGIISGVIDVSGGTATLSGTWLEEAYSSAVAGRANVAVPKALSISPTSVTLSADGDSRSFTASGGDSGYSWSVSNTKGTISGSGASVKYTRNSAGNNTITVTSGSASVSANIAQPN